jgi:hypothetical protein
MERIEYITEIQHKKIEHEYMQKRWRANEKYMEMMLYVECIFLSSQHLKGRCAFVEQLKSIVTKAYNYSTVP